MPIPAPFSRLGPALVWLREHRGLTQARVAELAGITAPHLSRIEAGQALPKLPTVGKLLVAMEADLTHLAVAHRAVEEGGAGVFRLPEHLPLDEQRALLISATGFFDYLEATSRRLSRAQDDPVGGPA